MANSPPDNPSQQTLEHPPQPDSAEADPLASLHKMSTTAGLGSQEYVAINAMSVAAALLGFASALALMGTVLLAIPVVAAVCSIIALRQIANSNGTQSGKGLALLGLILGIVFSGIVGGRAVVERLANRADEQEIARLIESFGQHIAKSEYDQAYALFSDRFQNRVRKQNFVDLWEMLSGYEPYGRVTAMRWNERLAFETDPGTGARYAIGMIILTFEKTEMPERQEARFRRDPGERWQFEDIPALFPAEQQPPPG